MVTVKVLDLMNELERTHSNALSRWQQLKMLLEQQQAVEHRLHPTNGGLCAICGRPEYNHSPNGHDFRPAISG